MLNIIFGNLQYLIDKTIAKSKTSFLGTDINEINCVVNDYEKDSKEKILDDLLLIPLGYDKKMVILNNATFLLEKNNELISDEKYQFLRNCLLNEDPNILIVAALTVKYISTTNEIYDFCNNKGKIIERIEPTSKDMSVYIQKKLEGTGVTASFDAVEEIKRRTAGDLMQLDSEIAKLSNYSKNITLEDVKILVPEQLETNSFNILSSLLVYDINSAIKTYRDLRVSGVEPVVLISSLTSQIKFLDQVYYLVFDKNMNNDEAAKVLGAKSGRIYMSLKNLKNTSQKVLRNELEKLYILDKKIKKGEIDRFVGFELFLINFGK